MAKKYSYSQFPNPFSIEIEELGLGKNAETLLRPIFPLAKYTLGLSQMERDFKKIPDWDAPEEFFKSVLSELDVKFNLFPNSDIKLPKDKPIIIVSNHPFGMLEALVMYEAFRKFRPELKFLANYLLGRIKAAEDLFILVDPFEGKGSVKKNIQPLREALGWLKQGNALVTFPAGTVSHLQVSKKEVQDPRWNTNIAKLARKSGATILPCFIHGRNSLVFQLSGLIHPLLRTALLPRQLKNKRGKTIDIQVGQPIEFEKLARFSNDREMTDYIRMRCYVQKNSKVNKPKVKKKSTTSQKHYLPVIEGHSAEVLENEVYSLPDENLFIEKDEFAIHLASAEQIPFMLREIGRLREITFREVGEGTGQEYDLDFYDNFYDHLFCWNREKKELVGAYRMVKADKAVERYGMKGLYTHTLFKYDEPLLSQMGPAVEMGRSFVAPAYQKSFWPLLLLWKGLSLYVAKDPDYKTLFGPVSISDSFDSVSRQLLQIFLQENNYDSILAKHVKPRVEMTNQRLRGVDKSFFSKTVQNLSEVSELISDIELREQKVPVLLREYTKLGGKIIGFNVDPKFSSVLDGLIVVDLTQTNPALLRRYMGSEVCAKFLAYHKQSLKYKKEVITNKDLA